VTHLEEGKRIRQIGEGKGEGKTHVERNPEVPEGGLKQASPEEHKAGANLRNVFYRKGILCCLNASETGLALTKAVPAPRIGQSPEGLLRKGGRGIHSRRTISLRLDRNGRLEERRYPRKTSRNVRRMWQSNPQKGPSEIGDRDQENDW